MEKKQEIYIYFFILNKFIDILKSIWIFSIFVYVFKDTIFEKKIKIITIKRLVQSPRKFSSVIWNVFTNIYAKFVTVRLFYEISKKKFNVKKNWKNSYGFWKTNKFIWKEKIIGNVIIYRADFFFTNFC